MSKHASSLIRGIGSVVNVYPATSIHHYFPKGKVVVVRSTSATKTAWKSVGKALERSMRIEVRYDQKKRK